MLNKIFKVNPKTESALYTMHHAPTNPLTFITPVLSVYALLFIWVKAGIFWFYANQSDFYLSYLFTYSLSLLSDSLIFLLILGFISLSLCFIDGRISLKHRFKILSYLTFASGLLLSMYLLLNNFIWLYMVNRFNFIGIDYFYMIRDLLFWLFDNLL